MNDTTSTANTADSTVDAIALNSVLVVVGPGEFSSGAPQGSALIDRAVALAKATGCTLELFHVCYEGSLTASAFLDQDEAQRETEKFLATQTDRLAEMALKLQLDGVAVSYEARWDSPRTEAILRKIYDSKPDLVMKQSRDYSYLMGLVGNIDWDLIRQSPAHVWFVGEAPRAGIDRIVAAIGANSNEDFRAGAADHQMLQLANLIAGKFQATQYPVHAYEVPLGFEHSGMYTPGLTGVAYSLSKPESPEQTRNKIAQRQSKAVKAFARLYKVEPEQIHIVEGHPSAVIPEVANTLDADLIVMAARNLSRWERALQSVTAEPVLADAPCDVLFVKDATDIAVPAATEPPAKGVSTVDLEKALMDPEKAFGSPRALAQTPELSSPVKRRILDIWEQDIRGRMNEGSESDVLVACDSDLIADIRSARQQLPE